VSLLSSSLSPSKVKTALWICGQSASPTGPSSGMDWPVDSLWTDKPPTACPPPSPHRGAFAHKLHSAHYYRV